MREFRIYPISALGGTLALSPLPGRTGTYATDLSRLRAWQPDIVVTMCTRDELVRAGAARLPDDLGETGLGWHHAPVPDFGTPDAATASRWPTLSATLRAELQAGGRVLIHCLGGCGRSGMAALRVMTDAGEDAGATLKSLREARPCAVETNAQMLWATHGVIDTA